METVFKGVFKQKNSLMAKKVILKHLQMQHYQKHIWSMFKNECPTQTANETEKIRSNSDCLLWQAITFRLTLIAKETLQLNPNIHSTWDLIKSVARDISWKISRFVIDIPLLIKTIKKQQKLRQHKKKIQTKTTERIRNEELSRRSVVGVWYKLQSFLSLFLSLSLDFFCFVFFCLRICLFLSRVLCCIFSLYLDSIQIESFNNSQPWCIQIWLQVVKKKPGTIDANKLKIREKKKERISYAHLLWAISMPLSTTKTNVNEVVNSNEMSMNKIKQKHGTHINRVLLSCLRIQNKSFSFRLIWHLGFLIQCFHSGCTKLHISTILCTHHTVHF